MTDVRVGFAGLGRMGAPMARNLARAGLLAGVYNRTTARAEELSEELGVPACGTPAELAHHANVVVAMVAHDEASLALFAGGEGLLRGLAPGGVAIEMSTVSVEHVRRLAQLLDDHGCALLDAPVSGSVAMARDGELTILVGGDEATFERVRPVLSALGSKLFHLGASGAGASMKLSVNAVIYGLNEALSEALVLAERVGLRRERAYEVFAASAVGAPFVHYRRDAFVTPDEVPVALRLELALKDLDLILGLARAHGHAMPQAELNARVLREAMTAGFADHDVSAVAEYLRAVDGDA